MPLVAPVQRHGADGHLLIEMNGGFRALQLKKINVSEGIASAQQITLFLKSEKVHYTEGIPPTVDTTTSHSCTKPCPLEARPPELFCSGVLVILLFVAVK